MLAAVVVGCCWSAFSLIRRFVKKEMNFMAIEWDGPIDNAIPLADGAELPTHDFQDHIIDTPETFEPPKLLDLCASCIHVDQANAWLIYSMLEGRDFHSNIMRRLFKSCVSFMVKHFDRIRHLAQIRCDEERNYFEIMHAFYKESMDLRGTSGGFIGVDFSITDMRELMGIAKESLVERQERFHESFKRNQKEVLALTEEIASVTNRFTWGSKGVAINILQARMKILENERAKLLRQQESNDRFESFCAKQQRLLLSVVSSMTADEV